jgi:hypothetical protein
MFASILNNLLYLAIGMAECVRINFPAPRPHSPPMTFSSLVPENACRPLNLKLPSSVTGGGRYRFLEGSNPNDSP